MLSVAFTSAIFDELDYLIKVWPAALQQAVTESIHVKLLRVNQNMVT